MCRTCFESICYLSLSIRSGRLVLQSFVNANKVEMIHQYLVSNLAEEDEDNDDKQIAKDSNNRNNDVGDPSVLKN